MSARYPTDVDRSLRLLIPRGGEIGPHDDGWGIAFYEGRCARVFKEPAPAAESRCLALISEYGYQSRTVVAHIRKANPSELGRSSANTHPFERELDGRSWVYAHNGKLPGLGGADQGLKRRFKPKGETDSELAFCMILNALDSSGLERGYTGSPSKFIEKLTELIDIIAAFGEFNFLLSDGGVLVVYAHTNLHMVRRRCKERGCDQRVILVATAPLTEEPWTRLKPETLHVFEAGREHRGVQPRLRPRPSGRKGAVPRHGHPRP
jgi:glutamine amidotransferase